MKRAILAFLSVAAAAIACSTLTTSADYDPSTDFSRYKTWDLKQDKSIDNALLARRIETAVTAELAKKGMTRNTSNPDFWVAVHGRMSKQTQINTYDTGWGYGYGWRYGGGMSTSTVTEVPVGTLIVDIVDAGKKDLVWRGTASDTLNPEASPEKKEANLQEAMAKLLANFPPPKKG
ncbi:MAG TPA: DUF4136 domain-containing protein [Thermoanaerobaculia bacterium]|nr:DUF4136 domain-containing protein [Thermoanaerobaculia bacterium]